MEYGSNKKTEESKLQLRIKLIIKRSKRWGDGKLGNDQKLNFKSRSCGFR